MDADYKKYDKIRSSKKLTNYEVAKRARVTQSTFSDWKSGRSKPKLDKLTRIAEVLGVPTSDLVESVQVDIEVSGSGSKPKSVLTVEVDGKDKPLIESLLASYRRLSGGNKQAVVDLTRALAKAETVNVAHVSGIHGEEMKRIFEGGDRHEKP